MFKIIFACLFFMSILSLFIGGLFFDWSNFSLGLVVIIYFGLQVCFSISNSLLYDKITNRKYMIDFNYPSIAFNIVGYREDREYWRRCLCSIRDIKYPRISGVFAFIDGNEEEDVYMKEIFDREMANDIEKHENIQKECFLVPHGGKRHVMNRGFHYIRQNFPDNQYIIVIDSDTILASDSVENLVRAIHWNYLIGCGTGSLKIFNRVNLITRLIHSRYGYAFDVERGAMSYVGCMNCCSGPFSIYRQCLLDDDLLHDFVNQKYCGQIVGPGDDRHLTNLILQKGYMSIQTPYAIAYTESPEFIGRFLQQQLRWMRSFYREIIWQIRAIPYQHPYLIVITTYELLFPFFILLSMFSLYFRHDYDVWLYVKRFGYAMGILLSRTLLLLWFQHGDIRYLFNLLYFPMYFIMLLPIKIFALMTCYRMQWVTSDRKNIVFLTKSLENIMMISFVACWNTILAVSFYKFLLLLFV